jgi:para-nitrobenzyl esterase
MMGCVENKACYFTKPGGNYAEETLDQMVRVLCGPQAGAVCSIFKQLDLLLYDRLDKTFTTTIFTEPAIESIRKFSTFGRRCYYYHFNKCSPGSIIRNEMTKYTAEIRYEFGTLSDDRYYDNSDYAVSELVQNAWISFARCGIPTLYDGHGPMSGRIMMCRTPSGLA